MKVIILVGDGMGDLPLAELQGRTPLAVARTPAMDYLARHGELGLVTTIPAGLPPGSDVANLSVLGFRPEEVYTGRAPLEAASLGVQLAPGQIAFRLNLVTLAPGADGTLTMADYSAGHISTAEARALIAALDQELASPDLALYPGVSYRHLLVLTGEGADLATVPPHDHSGRDISSFLAAYGRVPALASFMARARALLAAHPVNREREAAGRPPANGVWLWGQGRAPCLPTFAQRYGLRGSLISAVDLLKGIGVYAGLTVVQVPGATGYLDTNYEGKAQAALAALAEGDFVLVHVEAPDEASHQGNLAGKIQAIEDFDRRIVGPVLQGLAGGPPFRLAVLMDHLTPLALRTHVADPVPFVIYDGRAPRAAQAHSFCEEAAAATGLRLPDGEAFMERLLGRRP
ncbi:MAG: cofactor-independent phosphoglycerate mutase [Thermodesulfobacteriota bacterium]